MRMGMDKAALAIDGVTMIDRAIGLVRSAGIEAAIVGGKASYGAGIRVVGDDWPGAGPLGGIATALRDSRSEWSLVIACDMPYLTTEWLEFLISRADSEFDAVAPMNERGPEPLCALYHRSAEPKIRGAMERGVRKVTEGLNELRVLYLESETWKGFDSDGLLFKNMNEPADYEEAKARLGKRGRP